ncbi:MAG TPA: DUF72 domain-containing protein [Planctomycetota bacterium]|nr:DUF72 domain-containing protein [Planctomycetota bacterium]
MIRVGPAGWSYPDWDGVVYPRQKPRGFHPLRYLARFVDCIEINSTFYAMPTAHSASRWASLLDEWSDFRLTAKLHRDFTHFATHFKRGEAAPEAEQQAQAFLEGLAPLVRTRRLAALLVQFPISFHHGPAEVRRLGWLHAHLGKLPLVLELRHDSWYTPPALAAITGLGFSLAHIDLPPAWNHPPPWHAPTGPVGYLRLHGRNRVSWFDREAGRNARYDYLYSPEELDPLVEKARRLSAEYDETYVTTNNHFSGKAVANAIEIRAALRGHAVSAPPELVRAYPRLSSSAQVSGQQELF